MPIRDSDSLPYIDPKRAGEEDRWPGATELPSLPPAAELRGRASPFSEAPTAPRIEPGIQELSSDPSEMSFRATVDARDPSEPAYPVDRPTRPVARKPLSGAVLARKYELGTRLGVGGMGEVYRASHLTLGIQVAVKIMHPHIAIVDDYMRRFRREAHAASLLQHRNVVRVFDFGEDDDTLYLVMELLRGETVSRWLSRTGALPPISACVDVLTQVLDAFEAAHAMGIVHRDLKPENVFLADEDDGRRIVKVVDFGLAHVDDHRDTGPTLTNADVVSGTPEFMSPEQCRSLAVGPSTDIYALGCLLTDMLQGAPPFQGNAVEVMTQQMFVPPPPLKRPPGAEPVPPLLERLRLSLLAKSPEQRPADAREVKRLLLEATSPEAAAQRLPARKNETVTGRGDAGRAASVTGPSLVSPGMLVVNLARLSEREDGFGTSCATGLAAQGILVNATPAEGDPAPQVILLDAGNDVDAAAAWLRKKGAGGPSITMGPQAAPNPGAQSAPVVVCLAEVTADRMSTLIAAGAKDIVPYPVTSDVVAKKVRRAARSRG